jgi:hypothetical protein
MMEMCLKDCLMDSVITSNKTAFIQALSSADRPRLITDSDGFSRRLHLALHEFSICMVPDEVLMEFFEALRSEVLLKHVGQSSEEWTTLLDLKTNTNRRTALHMAVLNGRRVVDM